MSVLNAKRDVFAAKTAEAVTLKDQIAAAVETKEPTEELQTKFDALMDVEIPALEVEIKRLAKLEEAEIEVKANGERKAIETAARVESANPLKDIGELFAKSEDYKR